MNGVSFPFLLICLAQDLIILILLLILLLILFCCFVLFFSAKDPGQWSAINTFHIQFDKSKSPYKIVFFFPSSFFFLQVLVLALALFSFV